TAIGARMLTRGGHASSASRNEGLHAHRRGSKCSTIKATGSPDTRIEGRPVARAELDEADHGHESRITQGSATVFVNGKPLARENDGVKCGGRILHGCDRTWIGGPPSSDGAAPNDALLDGVGKWAERIALGAFLGAAALPLAPIIVEGGVL